MSIISSKAPQIAKAVTQNAPRVAQNLSHKAAPIAAKGTPSMAPKPHAIVGQKFDRHG